ncbi:hypothetical protein [Rhodobacter capsulatus]|uniref:hypothetical protein n=1 Tax=Rhodobacter capsulatus TaxID=1061 RepID=UPI0003D2F410|nr:hypothetical protein [Rhodobacter capsulatus]ETD87314.1 hypothetical protein U713_16780 [Rhodobacter capsulatus YW2]
MTQDRRRQDLGIAGREILPMRPGEDLDVMARGIGLAEYLLRRRHLAIGIEIAARAEQQQRDARVVLTQRNLLKLSR